MIYIAVMDYDAVSKDDCIGIVALSVRELLLSEEQKGSEDENHVEEFVGGDEQKYASAESRITQNNDASTKNAMPGKTKVIRIDRPVIWEGKPAGRLKCKVDVTISMPNRRSSLGQNRRRSTLASLQAE